MEIKVPAQGGTVWLGFDEPLLVSDAAVVAYVTALGADRVDVVPGEPPPPDIPPEADEAQKKRRASHILIAHWPGAATLAIPEAAEERIRWYVVIGTPTRPASVPPSSPPASPPQATTEPRPWTTEDTIGALVVGVLGVGAIIAIALAKKAKAQKKQSDKHEDTTE